MVPWRFFGSPDLLPGAWGKRAMIRGGSRMRRHPLFPLEAKTVYRRASTYPVERTMLTSGILDFALESRIRGYKKFDTPELAKVR